VRLFHNHGQAVRPMRTRSCDLLSSPAIGMHQMNSSRRMFIRDNAKPGPGPFGSRLLGVSETEIASSSGIGSFLRSAYSSIARNIAPHDQPGAGPRGGPSRPSCQTRQAGVLERFLGSCRD